MQQKVVSQSLPCLRADLGELVIQAVTDCTGLPSDAISALLAVPKNPSFGDYQSNAVMPLAKKLGRPSRELAAEVAKALEERPEAAGFVERVEVAGPGFLNFFLADGALVERLHSPTAFSPAEQSAASQKIVVDYSSPNIAKEMHVGHIRSTILGDAIVRICEYLGHRPLPQNHLGDWGTQFGMLVAFYREDPARLSREGGLADIEASYRLAHQRFQEDPDFQRRAKDAVVGLHNGKPDDLALWERIIEASRQHLHQNYQRLDVRLDREADRGESFYNPQLPDTIESLRDSLEAAADPKAQVRLDDGAVCVYLSDEKGEPLHLNQDGEPLPFLVQKSDGAFLYASTDLAALRYRARELAADRAIYVTDSRQSLHFEMLFATARATGFHQLADGREMELEHVTFGTVLGPDRKPLKTRDGQNVKLSTLLDEAVARAESFVPDEAVTEGLSKQEIAAKIGIGALKYADLSQNRQTDYIFSWDKLLAMEGNTAPYLMYAYARIASILREAGVSALEAPIVLREPAERALGLALLRLPEAVSAAAADWRINLLTDYLYGLSGAYMKFYETCPVLKAEGGIRESRLHLCALTRKALSTGLGLLGIATVERM